MRGLDDALKALSEFESLARYGLYPGESLEEVEHRNRWDLFKFAGLRLRVGQFTVEVHAHASDRSGHLNVRVWDFSETSGNASKFYMGADVDHVARVVVDYFNECEVAA